MQIQFITRYFVIYFTFLLNFTTQLQQANKTLWFAHKHQLKQLQIKSVKISIPKVSSQPNKMTTNNKNKPNIKIPTIPVGSSSLSHDQFSFGSHAKERQSKNRSYEMGSKQKKVYENVEEGFVEGSEGQYRQKCQKYEKHINYLQTYIEQLKQQKYQRQKYLVKTIKNGGNPSKSMAQPLPSSKITVSFDINQYMTRTNKQKQEAKEIQIKAKKLKQKQKMQRALLKKMKRTNDMLRSQQIQGSLVSQGSEYMSHLDFLNNRSQVESIQHNTSTRFEAQSQQKQKDFTNINTSNINMIKSRLYDSRQQYLLRTPPVRDNGQISLSEEPNIMSAQNEEAIREMKQEIRVLKQELQMARKELGQQKNIRESYEKHIFETDTKSAEIQEQHQNKIEEFKRELKREKEINARFEHLLKENLKLIRTKDDEIEALEAERTEFRQKMKIQNEENEKEAERIKQELERCTDKIDKINETMGISIIRQNPSFTIQCDMEFLGQKKQSIKFGEDSSDYSQGSTPKSQQRNLFDSTQLLETKIKQIQQQLKLAATEKQSLIETHSSLQSRIMTLSEENKNISTLHRKFTLQNQQLQEKLRLKMRMAESLELQKEQLKKHSDNMKEQSQKNMKLLVKLMEEQKNKEVSSKIIEITQKLEQNLAEQRSQKQQLYRKLQIEKQQNRSNQQLNQQLTSQIRSQLDLSFQLDQTINKQQNIIEKLQNDIKADKDKYSELEGKVKEIEGEKEEADDEIRRLKEEIQSMNDYIAGMNSQIVRSRIKEKEKEIELELQAEEKQRQKEKEEQKLAQPELQKKIDSKQEHINFLLDKIESLERSLREAQSQLQPKQQKISTLQHQLRSQQKKVSQMEQKIGEVLEETDAIYNKIKQLQQEKQTLALLSQEYNTYKENAQEKNSQLSQKLEKALHDSTQSLQRMQSSESSNAIQQKQMEAYKGQIQMLQKELQAQEEEISIMKLEKTQLEEANSGMEIQMDLLQNMINGLNTKVTEIQKKNKGLQAEIQQYKSKEEARLLKIYDLELQIQNKDKELKQKVENLSTKEQQISQLKQQNQENVQNLIHLQIQYDMTNIKIKEFTQAIANKEKQLTTKNQRVTQLQSIIAEMKEIKSSQEQKIVELQEKIQSSKQIFISGIPKLEDNNIESLERQLGLDKLKNQIQEFCESRVRQYNQDLFQIVVKFVEKLAQDDLIRDNRRYLQLALSFCGDIGTYAEIRYNKLQRYLEKMNESVEKIPQAQNIRTPDISSSPIINIKAVKPDEKITPKILKVSKSLQHMIQDEDEDQHEEALIKIQNRSNQNKGSVLLSQDFNDAFSQQHDDDDQYASRYKKTGDSIKQKQSSASREKDLGASGNFARSTHSAMEQLNAQEEYKKDMRNMKMKAKQQRRKL